MSATALSSHFWVPRRALRRAWVLTAMLAMIVQLLSAIGVPNPATSGTGDQWSDRSSYAQADSWFSRSQAVSARLVAPGAHKGAAVRAHEHTNLTLGSDETADVDDDTVTLLPIGSSTPLPLPVFRPVIQPEHGLASGDAKAPPDPPPNLAF